MADAKKEPKVMNRKVYDNEYLHKDFHGGLCYGVKYLEDNYGPEGLREYLQQVGRTFFKPLSEALKKQGLSALEKHWQDVFSKEGGKFSLKYEGDVLVLKVDECPAVSHIKKTGQFFTERFCEITVVVNETVCSEAGYSCSCEYEPGEGRCVQKFWKG